MQICKAAEQAKLQMHNFRNEEKLRKNEGGYCKAEHAEMSREKHLSSSLSTETSLSNWVKTNHHADQIYPAELPTNTILSLLPYFMFL